MIRVVLPAHLRNLAKVDSELELEVEGPATQRSVLDALEARYPMLQGTLRDHVTQVRRPFVRFFACEEDLSHDSPDKPLPPEVASGAEPFLIVGAIAGGTRGFRVCVRTGCRENSRGSSEGFRVRPERAGSLKESESRV
jgi:molybdopterin converting factor small subunit